MKKKEKILGYKIRRKSDGLYMTKGSRADFSKIGATWSRLCDVASSIKLKKMVYDKDTKDFRMWTEDDIMGLEIVPLIEGECYSTAWILDKLAN